MRTKCSIAWKLNMRHDAQEKAEIMRVRFSRRSEADLEEIADYIALDNPMNAITFIQKLRKRCQAIGRFPNANRPRFDLYEQMRSVAFGRYVIFYHVGKMEALIARILHSARDMDAEAFAGIDEAE